MPEFSKADFQNELRRFQRPVTSPAVDEKVRQIGNALANVTRLAWERALAHHDSPNEFPLPADADCQERAFFAAFATMSKGELRRLGKDSAKLLRQPLAARRQVLGDAAELDVKSPLTAVMQAKSRPIPSAMQITRADLEAMIADRKDRPRAGRVAPQQAGPPPAIPRARLVAKSIRCIRDSLEPGKDEIVLGGFFQTIAFDLTTGELKAPSIFPNRGDLEVRDLGKFKRDDPRRDMGNLEIETIFLGSSADDLPLMPLVTVFLGEKDLFGFGVRVSALAGGLQIKFLSPLISTFYISAALGNLSLIGLFSAASVLIASAWVAGITVAVASLLRLFGDELFNAGQMTLLVDAPGFSFPGGATEGDVVKLVFKRSVAHYELEVQWQLVP